MSSVSIRRAPHNHAQDIGDTWVSEDWIRNQTAGTPIPQRCAALISLATSVDEALEHLTNLYRRHEGFEKDVADLRTTLHSHTDQIVANMNSLQDFATSRSSSHTNGELDARITSSVDVQVLPLHRLITDLDARISGMVTMMSTRVDTLDRHCSANRDGITALTARMDSFDVSLSEHRALVDSEFVVMDSRIASIPSLPPDVPLSKSGRASLSAFEKSAKKRLSDHAAKLADDLHRKKSSPKPALRPCKEDGRRSSDASHWSAASESQLSQDAPADHEGLPRPLRGGGSMGSPTRSTCSRLDSTPSKSPSSQVALAPPLQSDLAPVTAAPSTVVPPTTTSDHGIQPQSQSNGVEAPQSAPRVPRFPTPWANASFYARDNPSSDYRTHQHDRAPAIPTHADENGEPPQELCLHGCTYLQREGDASAPHTDPSLALPPAALSVSPMGKVWHGGGSLETFGPGVRGISHEAVAALGVPSAMINSVIVAHSQLYEIWNRSASGFSQDRYSTYDRQSHGRSPSYLQSDALKFTGWTDLPQSGVTPEKWVEFYTALQLMAIQFGIGIMPFEGLDLQYAQGGHAFCICGLGYRVFRQMGSSLFLIIQKLLPTSDPQVVSKVQSVAQSGGTGFELLWLLTKHFVPMISVTRQLLWPVWPESDDIFQFARRVALYCNLCRMRGQTPLTEAQRSEMFLSKIVGTHRERAQHLLTTLRVSISASADGSLSPDLRLHLHDLPERLIEDSQDANGVMSTSKVSLSSPHPAAADTSNSLLPLTAPLPLSDSHIQGYCVNVARAGTSVRRAPPNPATTAARRGTTRTRRPPFDGNCDACGKYGHQAVTCDSLGMAIFMRLYCREKGNKSIMDEAEQNWKEKNKKWVSSSSTPRKILTRYCSVVGVPEEQIDSELDWDMLYSEEDVSTAPGDGMDTPECHRVATQPAIDWFNRSLAPSTESEDWIPHSCRVSRSPDAPPGSIMDSSPSQESVEGQSDDDVSVGEDAMAVDRELLSPPVPIPVEIDDSTFIGPSPSLRSVGVPAVDAAIARELASVFRALGTEPAGSMDVADWIWIRDPRPTIPKVSLAPSSRVSTFTLADSGSNVCLTNDLSILEDVHDIPPSPLDVALVSDTGPMCTKSGFVTFQFTDGTVHRQPFLYNAKASETILSPQHITKLCPHISTWVQGGSGDGSESGYLFFYGLDRSTVVMSLPLVRRNGLYYYHLHGDVATDGLAQHPPLLDTGFRVNKVSRPVSATEQITSELWAARLGYCGTDQLSLIPTHTAGTPSVFKCHPFRFLDVKEDARIQRQPRGDMDESVLKNGEQFHMDFGFIRASSNDYGVTPPSNPDDRVVYSFDGYSSYLLIMDRRSKRGWIFLRKSKEPPVSLVHIFLKKFGLSSGGIIRCDQGGELARSEEFRTMALGACLYVVEPTGADSPSQNGGAERWNGSMATTVRALLYGAGLPPKYWSAALLHAMYLHNRRVHVITRMTPYEAWHGHKPDLSRLRVFGSRVSVRKTGERSAKLDLHAYHGIFIGYSATDKNIRYIDLDSGVVKTCHHAVFDEAWYTQPRRPPTAQHLYSIGLSTTEQVTEDRLPVPSSPSSLQTGEIASASRINGDAKVVHEFDITHRDLRQVYFSPSPFNAAFEELIEKKYLLPQALKSHSTGGLEFTSVDDRLYLDRIKDGTPFAQLPRWRSRLRGAWLIQIDDVPITSLGAVSQALSESATKPGSQCTLLFSHSEVQTSGLTSEGIPQVAMDQMNPLLRLGCHLPREAISATVGEPQFRIVTEGDSSSLVSNATRLTRGKLMKQKDWDEWSMAEKLQWDQYEAQGMLGTPCPLPEGAMKFNIVWQYDVKHDGRKKARATCDGSTRGNVVRVLDHTYAGTPDHVGQRIFYLTSWNPSSDEIIFMYSSNLHGHGSSFVFKIKIYLY